MQAFLIKWGIITLLILAAMTAAFMKGIAWEQGRNAIKEKEVLVKRVEVIKKINASDQQISAAYERGRADRELEFKHVQSEFDKMRPKLDALPTSCDFPNEFVELLNLARNPKRFGPNSGKPAATVPGFRPSERWPAGNLRTTGNN